MKELWTCCDPGAMKHGMIQEWPLTLSTEASLTTWKFQYCGLLRILVYSLYPHQNVTSWSIFLESEVKVIDVSKIPSCVGAKGVESLCAQKLHSRWNLMCRSGRIAVVFLKSIQWKAGMLVPCTCTSCSFGPFHCHSHRCPIGRSGQRFCFGLSHKLRPRSWETSLH